MMASNGKYIIRAMLNKWMTIAILTDFLLSLSIASLLSILLSGMWLIPLYWGIVAFVICFAFLLMVHRPWKITERDMSRFLNRQYPEFEESSGLLLRSYDSLNLLEKLQSEKIEQAITRIEIPKAWTLRLKMSVLLLLTSFILCLIITQLPVSFKTPTTISKKQMVVQNKKVTTDVASVSIKIIPPAYTKKAPRLQNEMNLQVEENADVHWHLSTTTIAREVKLIFNDKVSLTLQPLDKEHTSWKASKTLKESGFYQVQTENSLSELFRIDIIKDSLPVINIQSPGSYTVIDFGQPQRVNMKVSLSDDYGVASSGVVATIASGSGEAVKFKAQHFTFPNFISGSQQYQLFKLLDLPAIGLEAGDELFFYVTARDNHGQESRSDIFKIAIPDTATLMSLEGMNTGVNLVPEYFRSQRQIIIETEQLIRARDTIPQQQFKNRSNNLGLDQKLLRLRYGKFLGEETENEIGNVEESHDKTEAHDDRRDFGNDAIPDGYSHKHDNAEDASFFEPGLKAQLKATLTEMWKAELQLRLYKPGLALPFEYKALRLLKELQQKSRVYVAKASYKTTPLKPENRLSGELDKIAQPVINSKLLKTNTAVETMRMVIPVLENLKNGFMLQKEEIGILNQSSRQLAEAAAKAPGIYLDPLKAMRRILDLAGEPKGIRLADIELLENAFQRLLPVNARVPSSLYTGPAAGLPAQYFKNLNRLRQ